MSAPRKPAALPHRTGTPATPPAREAADEAPRKPRALDSRRSSSFRPRSTSSTRPTRRTKSRRRRPRRDGARGLARSSSAAFGVAVVAGGRPVDRPADPRRCSRAPNGWAGWPPGWRPWPPLALLVILAREMLAHRPAGLGRKAARAGARRHRARRSEGGARRGRRACRPLSPASRKPPPAGARSPNCEATSSTAPIWCGIAETEILAPLDARAKMMILDAAKRVSLVTAVSPRALVDIAYVVFEVGPADPPPVGTLRRPARHAGLLPAGARRAGASGGDRRDRRRRRLRAADRRPGPRRAAFGEARRRGRQRHDDGPHRHRRHGDHAAPALFCAEAPGHDRFPVGTGLFRAKQEGRRH